MAAVTELPASGQQPASTATTAAATASRRSSARREVARTGTGLLPGRLPPGGSGTPRTPCPANKPARRMRPHVHEQTLARFLCVLWLGRWWFHLGSHARSTSV